MPISFKQTSQNAVSNFLCSDTDRNSYVFVFNPQPSVLLEEEIFVDMETLSTYLPYTFYKNFFV